MHKANAALAHSPLHDLWCYFKSFSWRYLYGKTKVWRYTKRGKLKLCILMLYSVVYIAIAIASCYEWLIIQPIIDQDER